MGRTRKKTVIVMLYSVCGHVYFINPAKVVVVYRGERSIVLELSHGGYLEVNETDMDKLLHRLGIKVREVRGYLKSD